MCTSSCNTKLVKLISKAIMDTTLRERFLADPRCTAQAFGFSEADQKELAAYEIRMALA
jgi:hypothetical protein